MTQELTPERDSVREMFRPKDRIPRIPGNLSNSNNLIFKQVGVREKKKTFILTRSRFVKTDLGIGDR